MAAIERPPGEQTSVGRDDAPRVDFDSTDPSLAHHDQEAYVAIRDVGPVVFSERHGGHWVVVSHALCRQVAADTTFSSASGAHIPTTSLHRRGVRIFALEHDGDAHRVRRKLLQEVVGDKPSNVPHDLVRRHARALVETLDRSSPVDLVERLANPLPLEVIFAITGANAAYQPEMKVLVDAVLFAREPVPGVKDPTGRIHEIATLIVREHLDHPRSAWISSLAGAELEGRPMSEPEMVAAVVSLITGGHHSTSRGLGSLLARVLSEPGLQARLRVHLEDIPSAIEETLRLHTPLPSFSRRSTRRVAVGGVVVEPAEGVLLVYAAGNRDPAVFECPDQFRLDRPQHQHLAFGFGTHRCVGIHLARAEMRIALEELFGATTSMRLVEPVAWRGPAEPEALVVQLG